MKSKYKPNKEVRRRYYDNHIDKLRQYGRDYYHNKFTKNLEIIKSDNPTPLTWN